MERIPLGRAYVLASSIIHELRASGVDADVLTPVGSLRRFAADVGGVALFAAAGTAERERLLRRFTHLASADAVLAHTPSGATIATSRGTVTLHVADPSVSGSALVWLTGSLAHVHTLSAMANEQGLQFEAGRLTDTSRAEVRCETEEEFYALFDLPFIPPELRHGDDEIEAAREGRLPQLLTTLHIRGDLHMHSTWSDGRDTIEEMVRASAELGYEYVAITDHSQSAWSSRSLNLAEIPQQREELETVRRRFPQIRILHGIEVDILRDGTLDFNDEVLASFDIVLASLHDHAGQRRDVLMNRYLSAIRSRHVHIIAHPMGRAPAQSDGYDLDFDALCTAAAESGTALEIDGAPGHLDLDGTLARRAAAAGVTLVVDSDCHRAEALRHQMRFGVATARRGWIEPRHVLNTRPVDDVLAFVAQKRS